MRVESLIKREIISRMLSEDDLSLVDLSSESSIEEAYEMAGDYEGIFSEYKILDEREDFRQSGEEVNIKGLKTEYSRHYEVDRVAIKLADGASVSWLYWYGGGKQDYPDAIDWMCEEDGACEVDCKEELKTVTVRTYSKK